MTHQSNVRAVKNPGSASSVRAQMAQFCRFSRPLSAASRSSRHEVGAELLTSVKSPMARASEDQNVRLGCAASENRVHVRVQLRTGRRAVTRLAIPEGVHRDHPSALRLFRVAEGRVAEARETAPRLLSACPAGAPQENIWFGRADVPMQGSVLGPSDARARDQSRSLSASPGWTVL